MNTQERVSELIFSQKKKKSVHVVSGLAEIVASEVLGVAIPRTH